MITFSCTCGKTFQVRDEDAGRTGKCTCGKPMQVPRPATKDEQASLQALAQVAEGEPLPSLAEPIDAVVPATAKPLAPPRALAIGTLPQKADSAQRHISGLSSLSAAGLTILLLAVVAAGSWLYLRSQAPQTEKFLVADAPTTASRQAKAPPDQQSDEQQHKSTSEGQTVESKAVENKADANQTIVGSSTTGTAGKSSNLATPAPSNAASTPSRDSAEVHQGGESVPAEKKAAAIEPSKADDKSMIDQSPKAQDEKKTAGATAPSATGSEKTQTSNDNRFSRLLSDLRNQERGGGHGDSMSLSQAIELCEFYPKHLPNVRFTGCLVHSAKLNESSLIQHYGEPDETSEITDDVLTVQGRKVDLSSKPSKMLRYGWLEFLVTTADGEIWGVQRRREPAADK